MEINALGRKFLQKLYKWGAVKNFKDDLTVLIGHGLFGKKEFYQGLDIIPDAVICCAER
jgi:hypothetical protein